MKISAYKIYSPLFILVILLQLYLPSFKINILFQILVLVFFLFIDRAVFSVTFVKQLLPFAALLFIGFAGTLLHKYQLVNIIKDLFHFIKPIIGILIGYLFFRRAGSFKIFAKTIVTASVISAIIHFLIIIFLARLSRGSIEDIREFTKDNFLELIGLFILLFYKHFQGERLLRSRVLWAIYTLLILFSITFYFSRTMIVAGIIIALSVFGYTKITSGSIKVIGVLLVLIGLFYAYLFSINLKRNKPGLEAFLYKVKNAPAEVFKTNIDRDNHAQMWDHWRGYEAKRALALMEDYPSSFIFGAGHGSLVNLKFYAPLTGDKKGIRYISELHNGYMYILYKTGFIGLIIYLGIIVRWYLYIYRRKSFVYTLISAIGVFYLFSTLTITGLFNNRDVYIFIIGGLFCYTGGNIRNAGAEPKAPDL